MKRLMASLACLTLLLCLVPTAVTAENENEVSLNASYKAEDGSMTISWNTASVNGYSLDSVTINQKTISHPQVKNTNDTSSFTVDGFNALVGTNTIQCHFLPEKEGEESLTASLDKKLAVEDLLGFTFSDPDPIYNASSGAFSLTYTPKTAGVEITSIEVDGNASYRAKDNQGKVTATISNLGYGSHSLTYYFRTPGNESVAYASSRKLDRAGTLTLNMKLSVESGLVVATLTDQNGDPVSDYTVELYLSGVKQRSQQSDASGRVVFNVAAPDDRSTVKCVAPSSKVGTVSYVGCEEYLGTPTSGKTTTTNNNTNGKTTTTGKATSTSTNTTETTGTTAGTGGTRYPMVPAAGTTATGDGYVAISTTFDTGIAGAFGLTEAEFSSRVRLLMEPDYYQTLVGSSTDVTPVLSLRSSSLQADSSRIAAAIASSDVLSRYSANDATSLTFDLSAYLLSSIDQSMVEFSLPEGKLKLQIPVPKSMEGRELAIAVITSDGLQAPALVVPENGIITIETNRLASLTLLSFPKTEEESQGMPPLVIVLIVVGVVLVVGAGVLIFFFFIRKPKNPDPEEGGTETENTGKEEPGQENDTVTGQTASGEESSEEEPTATNLSETQGTEETEETEETNNTASAGELERTMVLDFPAQKEPDRNTSDKNPSVPGVSLGSFAEQKDKKD